MTDSGRLSADALRRRVASRLADAGIDSAAADAAELVAQLLGVDPGRLLLIDSVSDEQRERIEAAVARRVQRVPLQHITSRAYFAGLELEVGPGVFIPRPETELLVEWALARIAEVRAGGATGINTAGGATGINTASGATEIRVVDLCSGSGALALAIAWHARQVGGARVRVTAVELSPTAGEYLQRNIDAIGLGADVAAVRADVTDIDAMRSILAKADVVVSNPPYVPERSEVSPEVAHDPPEAVFSGDSGMDLIDRLAPILAEVLASGVPVAIEHDDTTADRVRARLEDTGCFDQVRSHRDLADRPRFVSAVRRRGSGSAASASDCVEGWNA